MPPSSKSHPVPKNWPPGLPYLTSQTLSPTLTPAHLAALQTRPSDLPAAHSLPASTPRGPSSLVRITPIPTSSPHPAAGQAGLFAAKDLKAGAFILRYLGVVHASSSHPETIQSLSETETGKTRDDPHAESNYDLSLDRFHGLGIDADKQGNEARFINDYRGVPDREGRKANAEFREVWDEARGERAMGVWVLGGGKEAAAGGKAGKSLKNGAGGKAGVGIKKGEEILVSYGRGFWGARREEEEWKGEKSWDEWS